MHLDYSIATRELLRLEQKRLSYQILILCCYPTIPPTYGYTRSAVLPQGHQLVGYFLLDHLSMAGFVCCHSSHGQKELQWNLGHYSDTCTCTILQSLPANRAIEAVHCLQHVPDPSQLGFLWNEHM